MCSYTARTVVYFTRRRSRCGSAPSTTTSTDKYCIFLAANCFIPLTVIYVADPFTPGDSTFNVPFDSNFNFGSEAANLEYSILSAILGNPSPPDSEGTPPSYNPWPSESIYSAAIPELNADSTVSTSPSANSTFLTYQYQEQPRVTEVSDLQYGQVFQEPAPAATSATSMHPLQPRYPLEDRPRSPPSAFLDDSVNDHSSTTSSQVSKLQSINDRITKPYDYTEGYHFLMNHLRSRCVSSIARVKSACKEASSHNWLLRYSNSDSCPVSWLPLHFLALPVSPSFTGM